MWTALWRRSRRNQSPRRPSRWRIRAPSSRSGASPRRSGASRSSRRTTTAAIIAATTAAAAAINEMLHGTGFQNHARQYDDYLKEYYDWCMRYHARLPQGNMSHGGNYAGWTPYY